MNETRHNLPIPLAASLDLAPELVTRLIDAVPDGLLIVDSDGLIRVVNSTTELMFGYPRSALLGAPVEMLVPEPSRHRHIGLRNQYAADSTVKTMGSGRELDGRRSDGSLFPIEISLSPIATGRRTTATIATVRDITERRAAEARIKHVLATLDATRDALVIADPTNYRFTYANEGTTALTGYSRDELLTMTPYELVPSLGTDRFERMIERARDVAPSPITRNVSVIRSDGTEVATEVVIQFVGPTPVAVFRDVTERIAAAAALEAREREVRELVRAANSYVWSISPSGTLMTHEGELAGYSMLDDSMLGAHYSVAFRSDPESVRHIEAALGGRSFTGTRTIGEHTFHLSYEPKFDERGALVQVVGTATDTSDLQRIQDALETERDLFRTIVSAIQSGLYITNADGVITAVNPVFCDLVGRRRTELIDSPESDDWWFDVDIEQIASMRDLAMASSASPPESFECEAQIVRDDGTTLPVLVSIRRLAGADAQGARLTLVHDLTAVKAAATASAHIEAAQALLADRERIARDLHDTVIQQIFAAGMQLQALDGMLDTERAHERLALIVEMLDDSIGDLRTAVFRLGSRIGANGGLRDRVLDIAAAAARALGFEPSVRFDGVVDVAVSDNHAEHLCAIVRESLSNCARHAGASRVSIEIVSHDGHLNCTIDDDGVGLTDKSRGGSGLTNIADRAEQLGGVAVFGTSPLGGLRVVWEVPLDGTEAISPGEALLDGSV